MKPFIIGLLACLFVACTVQAKGDDSLKLPKTEQGLIHNLLNTLQYEDTITYANMFISSDTVWKMIFEYHEPDTGIEHEPPMAYLSNHPERIKLFDPAYNPDIIKGFTYVLQKGNDSGIHWKNISLVRYQLIKEKPTRDLIGYDKIAKSRLRGYIFIKDDLTRHEFCVTVTEMQQIDGYWYGGRVINIYPATTIDEYEAKLAGEMKSRKEGNNDNGASSLAVKDKKEDSDDEDDDKQAKKNGESSLAIKQHEDADKDNGEPKQVVDRKTYRGTFDKEIPIVLYVRYIKGGCPEQVCSWQAIYRFGDQDEFIKLDVSKTEDGKWLFVEDPAVGAMELTLKGKTYTGNWASSDNSTGYEVKLTETAESPKKLQLLDGIIEKGAWAKGVKDTKDEDPKPGPLIGADNVN